MPFSHDSLESYYKLNFMMMQHYNYSLTELDNMMPWERKYMWECCNNIYKKRMKE